jgi:hypothetical protein
MSLYDFLPEAMKENMRLAKQHYVRNVEIVEQRRNSGDN